MMAKALFFPYRVVKHVRLRRGLYCECSPTLLTDMETVLRMHPVGKVMAEAMTVGGDAGVYSQSWVLWLLMHVQKCYADDGIYSTCTGCSLCLEVRSRLVRWFSDYVHNSAGVVGPTISTTVSTSKAKWKRTKFCPGGCKSKLHATVINTIQYF